MPEQGPGQFGALGSAYQDTAIPTMSPADMMQVLSGRLTPQLEPEPDSPFGAPVVAPPGAAFGTPVAKKKRSEFEARPFGAATFLI